MGWTTTEWGCGYSGSMQLYGKTSARCSCVAYEAGRDCMACWLLRTWEEKNDPRSKRVDRFKLAQKIVGGKGIRIAGEEIIAQPVILEG